MKEEVTEIKKANEEKRKLLVFNFLSKLIFQEIKER